MSVLHDAVLARKHSDVKFLIAEKKADVNSVDVVCIYVIDFSLFPIVFPLHL